MPKKEDISDPKSYFDEISKQTTDLIKKKAEEKVTEFVETKLTERPNNIKNLIEKYGNHNIVKISVCRQPIEKINKILLNISTFGQLSSKLKDMNYDDVFHLYINIVLDNGLKFGMEKNEVVYILRGGIKPLETTDCKDINGLNIKVSTFFENGEKRGGKNFYRYNFQTDNCQKWVNDLLVSNGIKYLSNFVLQKIDQILKDKDLQNIGSKAVDAYALYTKYKGKQDSIDKEDTKVINTTLMKPVDETKKEIKVTPNTDKITELEIKISNLENIIKDLQSKIQTNPTNPPNPPNQPNLSNSTNPADNVVFQ